MRRSIHQRLSDPAACRPIALIFLVMTAAAGFASGALPEILRPPAHAVAAAPPDDGLQALALAPDPVFQVAQAPVLQAAKAPKVPRKVTVDEQVATTEAPSVAEATQDVAATATATATAATVSEPIEAPLIDGPPPDLSPPPVVDETPH